MDSRASMLEALMRAKEALSKAAATAPVSSISEHHRGGAKGRRAAQESTGSDGTISERSAAPEQQQQQQPSLNAKNSRSEFLQTWARRISLFVSDPSKTTLELPSDLSANDRRELHTVAEKFNLSHHSEGDRSARRLVLRKDALHYRAPQINTGNNTIAAPEPAGDAGGTTSGSVGSGGSASSSALIASVVDLDELMAPLTREAKESKYHLRRVHRSQADEPGGFGSYADEDAAKAVRRLERATNQYRKATAVGMTQEEMTAMEKNELPDVETILASNPPPALLAMGGSGLAAGTSAAAASSWGGQRERDDGLNESPARADAHEEVCLGCGTHAPVDYDVSRWECFGYCTLCGKDTVWKLQVVSTSAPTGGGNDYAEDSSSQTHTDSNGRKRNRDDMDAHGATSGRLRAESIDHDDDADDTLTADDAVDIATMNDMKSGDVQWVQRFARHHSDRLYRHLAFCIEYEDALSMPVMVPRKRVDVEEDDEDDEDDPHGPPKRARIQYSSKKSTEGEDGHTAAAALYIKLRESAPESKSLASLLDDVVAAIPDGMDTLSVVFPNATVYGTEASCACMISPADGVDMEKLRAIQKTYGQAHIIFGTDEALLTTEATTGTRQ